MSVQQETKLKIPPSHVDLKDFEGIFKYQLLYPLVYFINWVMVLTGPFYYPRAYFYYCNALLAYMVVRMIFQSLTWTHLIISLSKIIKKESMPQKAVLQLNDLYHAIIIPSYKEDFQILS